ncbi:portal protein [Mycobacterium phage LilMcDreamy]|uniref:Portal protein n=1 Tax=Mycobacterium phage LilMcDreamy TaxID=2652422 RepID=A0A5P8D963_9CAUD|nr:portal protein [Mycobacterium phage LilMcDreamy]QFP94630.1 portal protein [Mycobacterium phage LilMcDreamy]
MAVRIVRRPKGAPRRSLTAASQPVEDPQKIKSNVIGATKASWQSEAWDMLDTVGELRYYVGWRSSSCARVRLLVSELDPDGVPTGGIAEDNPDREKLIEVGRAIAGGRLGQSQLIKRLVECLTVPGESYIAIILRDDGEHWLALTNDEWKSTTSNKVEIEMPDGTKHEFVQGVDRLFRVWNPRPRRAKEADSPVRANLDPLREIVRTTKKIKNADKSRLVGGGVWFIPQEMSLPNSQAPIVGGKPGDPVPMFTGTAASEQLSDQLYNAALVSSENDDDAAAFIPIIATVPGEHLGKIMQLDLSKEISEVEIKKRNDAIARLAMGLDVSPERLLGLGSTTNHWSAWQVGDEDVQLHINPVMETICQFINSEVLRGTFNDLGLDPDRYVLWYDASQLTIDPDKSDEATEAHDRGAITSEAYRKYLGLGDEAGYDLSTIDGWKMLAQDVVAKNPEMLLTWYPLLDAVQGIDFPQPAPAIEQGTSQPPGEDEDGDTEGSEPDTENDDESANQATLARIHSRAEYLLAEQVLITRALELAGKRRVRTNDHDQRARLSSYPAHRWHRMLPPVAEQDIPKLINGWDSALEDQTIALLGVDTEALRARVREAIYRELTRPVVDGTVD